MKFLSKTLLLLTIGAFVFAGTAFSAKFIMKSRDGSYNFKCSRPGFVGKAKVKLRYGSSYQVKGPYFSGIIEARGPQEAAKKACGENRGI